MKNADQMSLLDISKAIADLAARARDKKLKPEDVQGGTFTITNPGVFGALFGMPIISQPQVAIVGVGAVEKRPVVLDDAITIRLRAYMTIGYDHRVIDGAIADEFMQVREEDDRELGFRRRLTTYATIEGCVSWKSGGSASFPYAAASEMQRALVEERRAGRVPDLLLLLEHPHVITLGVKVDASRSHLVATPEVLAATTGRVARIGPRRRHHLSRARADRRLSHPGSAARSLRRAQIRARSRRGHDPDRCRFRPAGRPRIEGLTGAWVGADKLGAIGVRISRWITSHGFAFNVTTDLDYFKLIVPCGIATGGVTSLVARGRAVVSPMGEAEASHRAPLRARCSIVRRWSQ